LYDNAQIAINYLEAYQLSGRPRLAGVARETLEYVLRDLRHPEGGFLSAEDADSLPGGPRRNGHKAEGAFYVWSKEEVVALAGPEDGELFCLRYGVRPGGNVMFDPQNEFAGQNVLYLDLELEEAARERGLEPAQAEEALERTRRRLFEARRRRPRPDLDDKVLVSWNGLMISALAKGFTVLGEPRFLEAARQAARFLRERLRDPESGRLRRRWRDGEAAGDGLADDYAFLVQGLLDLYEADFDPEWLEWALALAEQELRLFYDPDNGGFYMTASDHDSSLLVRMKESQDNVEPAASSLAALGLMRLAELCGRPDLRSAAAKTIALFSDQMRESPRSLPQMLVTLDLFRSKPRQIVIAGQPGAPDTELLLQRVRRRFLPGAVVLLADGGAGQARLAQRVPHLSRMMRQGGKATAYVCMDWACQAPVTQPDQLDALLDRRQGR
ncbi:MAG: thioredoxin domain-containing protein, partial [Elusimicrobia bacterium]|nr:thioredoxin domain-containing protein [Elusimicrobiota bacterium]